MPAFVAVAALASVLAAPATPHLAPNRFPSPGPASERWTPPPGVLVSLTYRSPFDGASRSYALRVPSFWDGESRVPAILFLHGRGGTVRQFQQAEVLDEADERGAVLVFWEGRVVPGGEGVPSTHYVDGADGVPDETDVLACLDDALARAPIDPDRVALAGFSQGGRGALDIGLLNPTRFAALVDAAGPTDAFQGQLWSPSFPDYLSAAGGPPEAGGETLARWYELSPRYLLPNARNLFVAVFHGQADAVVPDATTFFPYRSSHHVTVTPGFSDARGPQPTLFELRARDAEGYAFTTSFPEGVGHDQLALLPPDALFDAALGKSRPARPERVVGVSWTARERVFYWARLGRTTAPDGTRVLVEAEADAAANRLEVAFAGSPRIRLDLPAAGLDASRAVAVDFSSGGPLDLTLAGPFPPSVTATLDGTRVALERTADGVALSGLAVPAPPSRLVVAPAPAGALAEGDLLVPMVVRGEGANGARWDTVLTVGNLSARPLALEALLLDGASAPVRLTLPAQASRSLETAEVLPPAASAAAPLRLRVAEGEPGAVAASVRVFSSAASGSFGLSFPVRPASASVLAAGETALLFGPRDPRAERLNVSLFAPFEASLAEVEVLDAGATTRETRRVSLLPLRRAQLDDLLAAAEPGTFVRVRSLSGRLQAWGTAVSNSTTNDPWRVPAIPLSSAATAATVPAVASAEGRNGAVFRSDLFLLSADAGFVDATLLPRDGSAPVTARVPLAAGTPAVVSDLLAALFPSKAPGAGALALASAAPFLALSVTRSEPPTGPSSQDLPCVSAGAEVAPGAPAAFAGVDESPAARSNLVLVAPGPAARVRLVLLAGDGRRGEVFVDVGSRRVVQLDSVAALFPGGPVEGATLLVHCESGAVVASVARIDNATNDPASLSPLPVSLP